MAFQVGLKKGRESIAARKAAASANAKQKKMGGGVITRRSGKIPSRKAADKSENKTEVKAEAKSDVKSEEKDTKAAETATPAKNEALFAKVTKALPQQTSMSSRVFTSDEGERNRINYEVRFFFGLGITVFLTLCNLHMCKSFGELIYNLLHSCFGTLAYILPIYGFVIYLFLLSNEGSREARIRFRFSLYLMILTCCLLQLCLVKRENYDVVSNTQVVKTVISGGMVGQFVAGTLQRMIGTLATAMIIIMLILICIIILSQKSVTTTVRQGASGMKQFGGSSFQFFKKTIRFLLEGEILEEEKFSDDAEAQVSYAESAAAGDPKAAPALQNSSSGRNTRLNWRQKKDRNSITQFFGQGFPFERASEKTERDRLDESSGQQQKEEEKLPVYGGRYKNGTAARKDADTAVTNAEKNVYKDEDWRDGFSPTMRQSYSARQDSFDEHRELNVFRDGRPGSGIPRILLEAESRSLAELGFEQLLIESEREKRSPLERYVLFNGLEMEPELMEEDSGIIEEAYETENRQNRDEEAWRQAAGFESIKKNAVNLKYHAGQNKEAAANPEYGAGWANEAAVDSEYDAGWANKAAKDSDYDADWANKAAKDSDYDADWANKAAKDPDYDADWANEAAADPEYVTGQRKEDTADAAYGDDQKAENAIDLTEHVVLPEDEPVHPGQVSSGYDRFRQEVSGGQNGYRQSADSSRADKAVRPVNAEGGSRSASGRKGTSGIWKEAGSQTGRDSSGAVRFTDMTAAPAKKKKPPKAYVFPKTDLLNKNDVGSGRVTAIHEKTKEILHETLESFGVRVKMGAISVGPTVTRFELEPERGVKVSRIVALQDDIKLALAAADIRIEAPIPGKAAIGIEVPNRHNTIVGFRELIESEMFKKSASRLTVAVGRDISGAICLADLAKMPHLLIAGATGSGKSVCINTLVMSIIYKAKPEEVKLIMVDPKVVELSVYNGIPHLLVPVVTDARKAANALNWAVEEMNSRYKKFAEWNTRNIEGYNEKLLERKKLDPSLEEPLMYQMVIIVDELADLMMVSPGEVEEAICRLAQMARAAGIYLVLATQRPSVNVITGLIKANVPSRIAFAVSSGVDSRTIIDMNGAEKLLGKGDMLFYPNGIPKPVRVQGAFISDEEVYRVVKDLHEKNIGETGQEMMEKMITSATESNAMRAERDEYFESAARFIIEKDKASIGALQRNYRIGFNRAARLMDQLAAAGVVGEEDGTKPRKILMSMEEFENYMNS